MAIKAEARRVTQLEDLACLVEQRKAVIVPTSPCFNKATPAAWMINLSGHVLLSLFRAGMYEYEKTDGIRLRHKKAVETAIPF